MSDPQAGTIVVSGTGAAVVVPDVAQLEVSVEVTAADPATAYADGAATAHRVVVALDDQQIPESDRQTRAVGLAPHYEPMTPRIDGYTSTHTVLLRLARLAAVPDVLDALVEAAGEALRLGSFTLISTDTAEARSRAEAAAVADARDRAGRLADAAGVTLGPVLAIREVPTGPRGYAQALGFRADSGRESMEVAVQAGSEAITAQVTVTFALEGS